MNHHEFISRLKGLKDIPAKVKADLYLFYRCNRRVATRILHYISAHPEVSAIVALSICIAFLASHVPVIGMFASLMALVTGAVIAMMWQVRADLEATFATA